MNNWIAEEMARARLRRESVPGFAKPVPVKVNKVEPDKSYEEILADAIYECGIEPEDVGERVNSILDELMENGWDIIRAEDR